MVNVRAILAWFENSLNTPTEDATLSVPCSVLVSSSSTSVLCAVRQSIEHIFVRGVNSAETLAICREVKLSNGRRTFTESMRGLQGGTSCRDIKVV